MGVTVFNADDILKRAKFEIPENAGSDGAVYMVGAVTVRPAQGCVTSQREISLVPAGMHHVLRKKISNLGGSGHLSLTRTNFSLFSTMYELQPQPVSGCDFDVCDASELRHQYGSSRILLVVFF